MLDNPLLHRELFLKAIITFIMQMILIILILNEAFVLSPFGVLGIYYGDWMINSTRLVCAFLLHMIIVPEIKISLEIMKFTKNNPEKFYG